mgnify:CR=1 FL=1
MSARTSRVAITGDLTIRNAATTREQLLAALDNNDVVDIDLGGVGDFDSAGLQLLIAARKSAAGAGKHLRFSSVGRSVADVLDLYGLMDALAAGNGENSHES